jgi:hypothetical protein
VALNRLEPKLSAPIIEITNVAPLIAAGRRGVSGQNLTSFGPPISRGINYLTISDLYDGEGVRGCCALTAGWRL